MNSSSDLLHRRGSEDWFAWAPTVRYLVVSGSRCAAGKRTIPSWRRYLCRLDFVAKIGAAIATNKKRILTRESAYDNNVMGIIADTSELVLEFLHAYLVSLDLTTWASDADPPSMRKTTVENHHIPVPPLATQQVIVDELEAERELVSANRELVERMEQRIQEAIARVWEG